MTSLIKIKTREIIFIYFVFSHYITLFFLLVEKDSVIIREMPAQVVDQSPFMYEALNSEKESSAEPPES